MLGILLVTTAAAWTYGVAAVEGGRPGPVVGLLLGCGASFAAAKFIGRRVRWLVPAAFLATAAWIGVGTGGVLSSEPLRGPLGYANAKAAFYVQAAIGGMILFATARSILGRALGVIAAVGFAVVPFVTGSMAAIVLLALPTLALVVFPHRSRLAIGIQAALFVLAVASTLVLALLPPRSNVLVGLLTERRLTLWQDAFVIMRADPLTGVGPGRFAAVSPTARADPDARWAHHGFLQQGAETGILGFALLVLLFLWGFARLAATSDGDSATALGAAALAALGIHACADYVLHFPAIPIATAALTGAVATPGRHE